jgi:hypothetical protein
MPWKAKDAQRHTRKAKTAKRKRQWSDVANSVLQRTGDEAKAVRVANGVVKKEQVKHGKPKRRGNKRSGAKR